MRGEFIDPGALRTELTIEDVAMEPDGLGGHQETWSEAALTFGRVEPVRARASFGADQRLADVTHRITIRHRAGLWRRMRFRRGSRTFRIETIHDPDETARYLVCLVREEGR